ncbi:MAG: peptide chain release factor 1 [Planctomycetota bacterium]|nr:peptide chain release factor 1 [Planctomycetota bacterium]
MFDKVEEMAKRHAELDALLSKPETMQNMGLFKKYLQEHGALKKVAERFKVYAEARDALKEAEEIISAAEDEELVELAKEEVPEHQAVIDAETVKIRDLLVSEDEDDNMNVIMEVQAGAGGDEAALFVNDLQRMYTRVADAKGWKVEVLNSSLANSGGFKYITLSISGEMVHRDLQFESGGHRVQRVPATESQGRIHTSLATVVVMPEVEEVEVNIPDDEIKMDLFCASGPGGQHVNKTESAVRLVHIPTGIKVECQDEKSQHMNKAKAMRVLVSRVADHFQAIKDKEAGDKRRSLRGSGDRSQRVRTYNYNQNRVTDHRIGLSLHSLDRFMEGDIKEMVSALHDQLRALKLENL